MRVTDGVDSGARLSWLTADIIRLRDETPRVRSLLLSVPGWPGHHAGQHVDVRLTAEGGYQAQRSYSLASRPGEPLIELTIQRLEAGEVSAYLAGEARPGDRFEIRGPIGGHFVWRPGSTEPIFLVAGGSGIVPLMAMLRERAAAPVRPPARLLYSSRTFEDIIYHDELYRMAADDSDLQITHTLTDSQPEGWQGEHRLIDKAMINEAGFPPDSEPIVYVCGPTGLVEAASNFLVELGHTADRIKTERFGPTGSDQS